MNTEEFEALFPVKIQDLISLIIEREISDFNEAVQFLYESKLYEKLADEKTKLWHLSSEKLLEILLLEKRTGELIYPDYV
jgi:hypothetical protein